jgi:hydroxymethylpyrimidine pyrophosphatase-like HAD family hydrolase
VHVIVVTGRMFRATRPYLEEAGLDDPVICYQGALVADPASGEFLRHASQRSKRSTRSSQPAST